MIEAAEEDVKPAPQMSNVEKAILQCRKIDAKLDEIRQRHKDEIAPLITQQERLEAMLKQYLEAQKFESLKTGSGTAILVKSKKPQVEDWGAFNTWVVKNERPDMLQKRLMESTFNDYVDQGNELPDGTSVMHSTRLTIREPKAK